ncbi:MAG: hypothetical protein JWL65_7149, partial [Gammaproteobacteria bacterium]|nr:hypothetical protein [Gammaproteobacteria bacterium]
MIERATHARVQTRLKGVIPSLVTSDGFGWVSDSYLNNWR